MAGTIMERPRIIRLTTIGRLLPPLRLIIPPRDIPVLLPRTLMTIPAVGMTLVLRARTLMAIPAMGRATRLAPLAVLGIPAIGLTRMPGMMRLPIPGVSMAAGLMARALMAIPTLGRATMLLPLMRLPVEGINRTARLGRSESLTMRLRGNRPVRPGLGAQRAQSHKHT
jgi:hypothetical protein